MVDISVESIEETEAKLRRVIGLADLRLYKEMYSFEEFPLQSFAARVQQSALALVRDDEVWSQLVPSSGQSAQTFALFRFHFPAGVDNSGFVGWLATHFKRLFGTGVFVVCGQNSNRGGIFDYWGCPEELQDLVFAELQNLLEFSRKS